MSKNLPYTQLFHSVMQHAAQTKVLTIQEFTFYNLMLNDCEFYKRERGHYSPSQSHYAEKYGVSRRYMVNVFKKLEDLGILKVVYKKLGYATQYEVLSITEFYNWLLSNHPLEDAKPSSDIRKQSDFIVESTVEPLPESPVITPVEPPVIAPVSSILNPEQPIKVKEKAAPDASCKSSEPVKTSSLSYDEWLRLERQKQGLQLPPEHASSSYF